MSSINGIIIEKFQYVYVFEDTSSRIRSNQSLYLYNVRQQCRRVRRESYYTYYDKLSELDIILEQRQFQMQDMQHTSIQYEYYLYLTFNALCNARIRTYHRLDELQDYSLTIKSQFVDLISTQLAICYINQFIDTLQNICMSFPVRQVNTSSISVKGKVVNMATCINHISDEPFRKLGPGISSGPSVTSPFCTRILTSIPSLHLPRRPSEKAA